jgi:hypothetical protein
MEAHLREQVFDPGDGDGLRQNRGVVQVDVVLVHETIG